MNKTRFAPSPTGFLHIGGARTALFSWAFAKKNQGHFALRIEDSDRQRSTDESVTSILDAMKWLGLDYQEGPIYQSNRAEHYQEVIKQLLAENKAYYCYCSVEELEQMRSKQKELGLKPKYDGRCLHNNNYKENVSPVVRFKNPKEGSVVWHDLVKGRIEINNEELDDLVIMRQDNSPTYNFCVVVDDYDMQISHVVRGDDHVNNTPRQINILQALNAPIPEYAHIPMILASDGQKMSKRRDAVNVMEYKAMGILPEALLNYLARLCWGHENAEIFTMNQFIEWFDLKDVSLSAAQFDYKKLLWVNSEHIKNKSAKDLLILVNELCETNNLPKILEIIDLLKIRSESLNELVEQIAYFKKRHEISLADKNQYLTANAMQNLNTFAQGLNDISWNIEAIKAYIKLFLKTHNIKMPELGMPLRLKLCGTTQTPSIDDIIFILGKDEVKNRINA